MSHQPPPPTIAVHRASGVSRDAANGAPRESSAVMSLTSDLAVTPIRDDPAKKLSRVIRENGVQFSSQRNHRFYPYGLLRRLMTPERVRRALGEECKVPEALLDRYCAKILPVGLTSQPRRWCANAQQPRARGSAPPAGYLTVFALLLSVDCAAFAVPLIDHGLSDARLPLDAVQDEDDDIWSIAHLEAPASTPDHWFRYTDIDLLTIKQWSFFTPFFGCESDGEARHYLLPQDARLPWRHPTEEDEKTRKYRMKSQGSIGSHRQDHLTPAGLSGGFGTVELVIIDPESHGFHGQLDSLFLPKKWFAIKSLKAADAKAFQKEIDNLKRFNGRQHGHLVTLLATFTYGDRYSFIFPCADHDLDDHWRSNEPVPTAEFALWVSSQVLGLTGAIDTMHAPLHLLPGDSESKYMRHGDLKPENILFFSPPVKSQPQPAAPRPAWAAAGVALPQDGPRGKLVITDFGLADVHRAISKSHVQNGKLSFTKTWAPPECDMAVEINNQWDIWSLGCVFLEMACWMLGGQPNRDKFARERVKSGLLFNELDHFYDVRESNHGPGSGARQYEFGLKDQVVEWIVRMHRSDNCTVYIHDLLKLVYEDMLVVRRPPHTDRIRSHDLLRKVQKLHDKALARGGKAYLEEHKPWRNHVVDQRDPITCELEPQFQRNVDEARQAVRTMGSGQSWTSGWSDTSAVNGEGPAFTFTRHS